MQEQNKTHLLWQVEKVHDAVTEVADQLDGITEQLDASHDLVDLGEALACVMGDDRGDERADGTRGVLHHEGVEANRGLLDRSCSM